MKRPAATETRPLSASILRLVGGDLPMPRPELGPVPQILLGLDSRGRPKSGYVTRIGRMPHPEFLSEAKRAIYASAETTDPRADAHWQCAACFREARLRWTADLMALPWDEASWHAGLEAALAQSGEGPR